MLGLVSRAKGSACSWAHWLAEGICHSPAFCAVETLGSAVHSLSCSGLQWKMDSYNHRAQKRSCLCSPASWGWYAHQRSLPRHSSEEAPTPCLSCIVSVLLFFSCISSSHFFSSTLFPVTVSCWPFSAGLSVSLADSLKLPALMLWEDAMLLLTLRVSQGSN